MTTTCRPRMPSGSQSRSGAWSRRHAGHGVGGLDRPLGPGAENPPSILPVPHHHPGAGARHGQEVELDGGDDPEPAPSAASGPEQLAVAVLGGADERAVGQHHLDGRQRAALQPVRSAVPADAAPQGRPDDADRGARHVPGREPRLPCAVDDVAPEDSGTDARGPPLGVDGELRHRRGAQQHRVAEPPGEGRRAVTRALGRHLQPGRGGSAQDGRDLVREGRVGDGGWPGVDVEVPGDPRLVVERVTGQVHGAAAEGAEVLELLRGGRGRAGGRAAGRHVERVPPAT